MAFVKGRGRRRKRVCHFCANKLDTLDYKDVNSLNKYITDRGKIKPRRATSTCAKHQRMVATAVKRSRHMAFIPFVKEN
ncbi:MAG: 30S ribosomal protein S18 [Bacilli bacterium]